MTWAEEWDDAPEPWQPQCTLAFYGGPWDGSTEIVPLNGCDSVEVQRYERDGSRTITALYVNGGTDASGRIRMVLNARQ